MYQPDQTPGELHAVANVLTVFPDAQVIEAPDMGAYAVEYALQGLAVGPLCKRDRDTGRMIGIKGKDPVGHLVPHGVKDFTTDIDTIIRWWSENQWNIGARVPESCFALDADGPDRKPYPGTGMEGLAALHKIHGKDFLPTTFKQHTGSDGRHYLYRRPPGKLTKKHLKAYGLDFKTSGGYIVMAPSIHPDSGRAYVKFPAPIVDPPQWLIDMIVEKPKVQRRSRSPRWQYYGHSSADTFSTRMSWQQILTPHGWECLDADPDADGARWLHPTATSSCSATVKNGCLFVYSPNTPFKTTEEGDANGYTRFKAAAVLANTHLSEKEAMSAFSRQLNNKASTR